MSRANVTSLAALASSQGLASARLSALVALVALGDPPSRRAYVSSLATLVSAEGKSMANVSEVIGLVSYVSTEPERLNSRAWTFHLDQHGFYVLHLGMQGTFVYDTLTEQWSQWQTAGYTAWNMERGVTWNNEVYAGGTEGPTLWRLDPNSSLDEDFRIVQRVVTGGIPAEAREAINTGMFVLDVIKQGTLDELSTPTVQLSISDDGGFTYRARDAIVVNSNETQDFSWRSLGSIKAPGRVFKITDSGSFVTIKGANQTIVEKEAERGKK